MLQIAEHIMQVKTGDSTGHPRGPLSDGTRRDPPGQEGRDAGCRRAGSAVSAERHQPDGRAPTQHGVREVGSGEAAATTRSEQAGQALVEYTGPQRQLTYRAVR